MCLELLSGILPNVAKKYHTYVATGLIALDIQMCLDIQLCYPLVRHNPKTLPLCDK